MGLPPNMLLLILFPGGPIPAPWAFAPHILSSWTVLSSPNSQPRLCCSCVFPSVPCTQMRAYVFSHSVISCRFVTPWTITFQAPLSMRILQARILEWVALPSSSGFSWPRDRTRFSCIGRQIHQGSPLINDTKMQITSTRYVILVAP